MIQLGRQLAKVSRPEAFWSLVEFNRIVPSAWKGHNGVPLIIKYLYPSNVTNFYNYRDNEIGLEGESDKKLVKHYPNFPIVTLKGIPFFLSYGYEVDDFEEVRSWEWNDDSCMFEKPKVQ